MVFLAGPVVAIISFLIVRYFLNHENINSDEGGNNYDENSHKNEEWQERQYEKFTSHGKEEEYYKILGIHKGCSKVELKKSYRKKMSAFHPDKIQGAGLSEEFIGFANNETKKINEAYSYLSTIIKE